MTDAGDRLDAPDEDAEVHQFQEVREDVPPSREHLDLGDLKNVDVSVSADLGRCKMLVRDVLDLQEGSVIQLDKLAGEMTDIYVNDLPLAKGEVVVIGDTLHVRVGEIIGEGEKVEDIRLDELAEEVEDDEI
ncbi:MAG: hypothetical protein GY851_02300 [bacterium]|nr:hypothetical protein [bacterium]